MKRKKRRGSSPLLRAEAEAAQISPLPSPETSPGISPQHSRTLEPALQSGLPEQTQSPEPVEQTRIPGRPLEGLIDASLIGRSIKLVRVENWEDDLIPTNPKETRILYENQRGCLSHQLITLIQVCSFSGSHISAATRWSAPVSSTLHPFKTQILS